MAAGAEGLVEAADGASDEDAGAEGGAEGGRSRTQGATASVAEVLVPRETLSERRARLY